MTPSCLSHQPITDFDGLGILFAITVQYGCASFRTKIIELVYGWGYVQYHQAMTYVSSHVGVHEFITVRVIHCHSSCIIYSYCLITSSLKGNYCE